MIHINRSSQIPLYLQIKNQLRDLILSGVLVPGFQLPPERKLAENLGVNRSTVLNAYNELKADRLIEAQVGRGTVVIKPDLSAISHYQAKQPVPVQWRQLFSAFTTRPQSSLLQDIMKLLSRKDVISFALGTIPTEFYPLEIIEKLQIEVLQTYAQAALALLPTEGYYPLRESMARLVNSWGVDASADEIIIISGSQQGIYLLSKIFIDPGDVVVVEEPTFFCAVQIFQAAGARLVGIPVDEHGMRTDLLETVLARCRPKLIYTIPTYQNPSGVVMSMERRRHLLDLSYRYQIPIMEDDSYSRLYYEDNPVPPLKSLDQHGHVLYLGSFSKLVCPGFRIGWLVAPHPVVRQFALTKQLDDLHANSMAQYILHEFLQRGFLDSHLQAVRQEYVKRRDAVVKALKKYAPPGLTWSVPAGGLYLWCRLPQVLNDSTGLLRQAVKQGVSFMPGEAFFIEEQEHTYIRLNFTSSSPDMLEEGIRRLTKALTDTMQAGRQAKPIINESTPLV